MSATNDGGPAFPTVPKNHGYDESQGTGSGPGMTLRDWFAGKALQGILACPEPMVDWVADISAENAYKQADAMLKARNK